MHTSPKLVVQLLRLCYNLSAESQGFKTSQKYQNFGLVALVAPVLLLLSVSVPGQNARPTTPNMADTLELEEVVVTATRNARSLSEIPVPVTLIQKEQVQQMGSLRLSDILREQTGLAITNDHGQGIQMQGFDPDYTLILIDGEPLVGRTAGTLELSRLAVGNIKRIEIVKGPSSSLYGSEALAGVVNIITENPERTRLDLSARYGTNQTTDLGATFNFQKEKLGINLFLNRYSSSGYDLTPEGFGNTVEPFENYTLQSKIKYDFHENVTLTLSGRYFEEVQDSRFQLLGNETTDRVTGEGRVRDYNLNPVLRWRLHPKWETQFRTYLSGYHTESELWYQDDRELYEATFFEQQFFRLENQTEFFASEQHVFTFGMGRLQESVAATRYAQKQYFTTLYGFFQHEFTPTQKWNITTGGRIDHHSVYGTQWSPKVAAQYDLWDDLKLRASVGRGFKAPDFRQLYLNFTNAVAGYAVFGTEELPAQLQTLQEQGQIDEVLLPPSAIGAIRAETSWAYNLGFSAKLFQKLRWNTNFFRNEVRNLIESQLVAIRTNGQSIFSYRNLNNIFTQGIETDLSYELHAHLRLSAGYQFLEAKDKEVLRQIENGELFRRDPETLATVRLRKSDYGGLFGRSRHMTNLKLFYDNPQKGVTANLRGVFRGRYGLGDRNGNLILDQDNEYVEGFWTWNVAASKSLWKNRLVLQLGCDNLLGVTDAQNLPGLPGRLLWASLRFRAPN